MRVHYTGNAWNGQFEIDDKPYGGKTDEREAPNLEQFETYETFGPAAMSAKTGGSPTLSHSISIKWDEGPEYSSDLYGRTNFTGFAFGIYGYVPAGFSPAAQCFSSPNEYVN